MATGNIGINNGDIIIGDDGLARPKWAAHNEIERAYYDTEWGIPVNGEAAHFERLSLEAFQSGLSWATILRKRPQFRLAFANFNVDEIAAYSAKKVEELLGDAGIVRHRGKIQATINNAIRTQELRADGGLVELLWSFKPPATPQPRSYADVVSTSAESIALSKELRRRGFKFVGPTTMYALMEAIGIIDTNLLGTHRRGASGVW